MKKTLTLALVLVLSTSAWAQKKETGNPAFDALDRNRDGFLGKEEVAGEKELAKRFVRFDANKDGRWNVDEYVKANKDNDSRIVADSAITTQVKALLLAEKGVPSTAISVETYEGRVMLSGFLDSKEQMAKAVRVASGVSGVKKVQNNLTVK
ncbi:MAG: BON domain-containing protein [Betaproteobacteria bacterium]|nr:BON domain-containing protein [Betaproteobacteria bacterium]